MKFIQGEKAGLIWDKENDRPLADFENGIFETSDEEIIAKLEKLGFDFQLPTKMAKGTNKKIVKDNK